jgi:POT family proton-dependent oligopeptide transporter
MVQPPREVGREDVQTVVDVKGDDAVSRPRLALPKPFWQLALTEIWERFSFYGLQGVLGFYLLYSLDQGGLDVSPAIAVSIIGGYSGLIYLMQVVGGWMGDRVFPPRLMVLFGAVAMMTGHVTLSLIPGIHGLVTGLVFIVAGTGALKTNITAIIGATLPADRSMRDAGFSYFLMAVNTGCVLGPIITGWVQSVWGFHLAFLIASIGMAAGLVQYVIGYKDLPPASRIVRNRIRPANLAKYAAGGLFAVALLALLWSIGTVNAGNLTHVVGACIALAAGVLFSAILRSPAVASDEKRRVAGYVPLWVVGVLYYGILLQVFTTVTIFVTERVDLDLFGWQLPATWLIAVTPLVGVIFTPLITRMWARQGPREPSVTSKFAIGLVLVSGAYLLLLFSELTPGKEVSPALVLVCMALAGPSEVFVNPVTLSLVTRIAPQKFGTQMTALGVLIIGGGAAISGVLGVLYTVMPLAPYLISVGVCGLATAAAIRLMSRRIESLIE